MTNGDGRAPSRERADRKRPPNPAQSEGLRVLGAVAFILALGVAAAVVLMNSTSLR